MDNSVGSYPWDRLDPEEIERRKREAYRAVLRQKRRKKRLLKIRLMFAGLVLFVALILAGIIFTIVKHSHRLPVLSSDSSTLSYPYTTVPEFSSTFVQPSPTLNV